MTNLFFFSRILLLSSLMLLLLLLLLLFLQLCCSCCYHRVCCCCLTQLSKSKRPISFSYFLFQQLEYNLKLGVKIFVWNESILAFKKKSRIKISLSMNILNILQNAAYVMERHKHCTCFNAIESNFSSQIIELL